MQNTFREKLKTLSPRRLLTPLSGEAAVLVSVQMVQGIPGFLLTRRSDHVRTHKGDISFPGGMREPADASLEDTALRETAEELGISTDVIEVVGEFHEYESAAGHRVKPFVGFLSPETVFKPEAREVAYLLHVPFEFFRTWEPQVKSYEHGGRSGMLYYYDFQGETIWGLTAAIIRDFLQFIDATDC